MVLDMAEWVIVRLPLSSKDCGERGEDVMGHRQSQAFAHPVTRKAGKCNFTNSILEIKD